MEANPSQVVARVNGVPIVNDQVSGLLESVDGGLTVEEALDVLIRNELLAGEAKRRGFESSHVVKDVRQTELARVFLLRKIGEEVNSEGLDNDRLEDYYELKKLRFVHGVLRRIVHILVLTGKNGYADHKAKEIASEVFEQAKKVVDEEGFVALGESFKKDHKNKIKVESLPPFQADNKQFVSEFVTATFSVPKVGGASQPCKTKFGWHVIYVAEERPEENLSFKEVRDQLAEEVLPVERKMKVKELLEKLRKNGNVFVYDNSLGVQKRVP